MNFDSGTVGTGACSLIVLCVPKLLCGLGMLEKELVIGGEPGG